MIIDHIKENQNEINGNNLHIEEIQKSLFAIIENTDKNNERQERFKEFIEFREIKEEDYTIITELYTYPNDTFIKLFHNEIYYQKENLGNVLKEEIDNPSTDRKHKLKRFFELFLQFFEKYDRITTNHLNRIMEDKKEYKR